MPLVFSHQQRQPATAWKDGTIKMSHPLTCHVVGGRSSRQSSHIIFHCRLVPQASATTTRTSCHHTRQTLSNPYHVFSGDHGLRPSHPLPRRGKETWQLAWWSTFSSSSILQSRFRRAEDNARASAARSSRQWQRPLPSKRPCVHPITWIVTLLPLPRGSILM